jgi:uncharacterized protein
MHGRDQHGQRGSLTMLKRLSFALPIGIVAALTPTPASAQQFGFRGAAVSDTVALSAAMPELARAVITVYRPDDRVTYLDNLFRLQMVAGRYADADTAIAALRAWRSHRSASPQAGATDVQYQVLARAQAAQRRDGVPFDVAFRRAFRDIVGALDDRTAALVIRGLTAYQPSVGQGVRDALQPQKDKSAISLADALRLVRVYQVEQSYRAFMPLTAALIAEDDDRRYVIDKDIPVGTPDGATVCAAFVVRPRRTSGRLPALLEFSIYHPLLSEARRSASNGYAGIQGQTRGKGCSPDTPVPYEHDGADAAALIDWIAAQPWSDGRVGMYSGSYNGFTQWAAAKQMPKALKALMPSAPVAPGIDVPMEDNVFWTFVYPWTFYTTDGKDNDNTTYNDQARWNRMTRAWYLSGRAYRDLDKIDGTPNPIFDRWLEHPSYDMYWQAMIPYREDFARIHIPVLATGGYYFGGPGAAIYYFAQHYKYDARADHYLVIGPYDHVMGQTGPITRLGDPVRTLYGYALDSAALIDVGELRYQWFDYVFKGAPKPALLQDKVNYEVMGANVWKHAPSFAAMADHMVRFHLSATRSGHAYRLAGGLAPAGDSSIVQTIDLADRTDADRISPGGGIADTVIDTWNGVEYVSDPFTAPTEISGLFSGRLDFSANTKDFDLQIQLYELTTAGTYIQLSPFWTRASYNGDVEHRRLLTPGKRQSLVFQSGRLMSRLLEPGSRLVAVLSIIKNAGQQINYGTGKDVSDETIADASTPLEIRWFADSYIDVPVGR